MSLRAIGMLAALLACGSVHAAGPVRPLEADSFRKIVAAHEGKPFVVVVWALDCDYCEPSFKSLAQAQRRRKLPVVAIATDRAGDADAVRYIDKKLAAAGLDAERWAFGGAPAEQLRYAIDPKWRGEMPRSYWFDGRGAVKAHSGVITKDLIETLGP
jgi:thiol-disulfide isomerase/thioredoxin